MFSEHFKFRKLLFYLKIKHHVSVFAKANIVETKNKIMLMDLQTLCQINWNFKETSILR